METIPTVNAELDDSASQFAKRCLCTPTILRKILEQFSNRDLLSLQLVNKEWNFEARSVLQNRGSLIARIFSHGSCQSLIDFASDLRQMRVVPFSGIRVVIGHNNICRSPWNEALDYNVILDRLPCKYLSVSFRSSWENYQSCQALKLVHKILDAFCGTLEEISLSLDDCDDKLFDFLGMILAFHNWNFPRLKTLKVKGYSGDEPLVNFVKALVSHAPNLEEFNFDGGLHFQKNILEGTSAVLVPASEFYALYEGMCESLIGSLRAETIEILVYPDFPFDVDVLNRAVPMALQASQTTLQTLQMDLLFAVPLMCYGICLENVTKLEILMLRGSLAHIPPHILTLLKAFDFTRVFPNVEEVKIVNHSMTPFTPEHISSFIERGNVLLKETLPDRAVNIKHVKFCDSHWDSALPFWAQMFPQTKKLSLCARGGDLSQLPFTLLWEQFVNLEELCVASVHRGLSVTLNLDSIFCGIFLEEVTELMEKDDEYLKAVNIVPVMPSITCMKGLRTFTLDFTMPRINDGRFQMEPSPMFLFSKVTAFTCFTRLPGLAVTLESNSYSAEALNHMKPYVSCVSKSSTDQTD